MLVRGVIAFPITPADAEGRVDAAAFRRVLARLRDAPVDAVCVLGSTGGYAYLGREERRRAVALAAAELADRMPLMAGVGALRTDHAVAHARDARAEGASAGLLAPVSYVPLTDVEVAAHFEAVAAEGGLPLCIYDNPAATHRPIGDELLEQLAAIQGVVALKAPAPAAGGPERLAALRSRTPAGFAVGFSTDPDVAAVLPAGPDAWFSVLAGLFPAPAAALWRASAAGDAASMERLDAALRPLWTLMRAHGGLRVMHAAADAIGLCADPPPRPVLPPPPEARAEIARTVEDLRPLLEGDADPPPGGTAEPLPS